MIRNWSYILILMLFGTLAYAQEEVPVASIDIPAQNMLKFNRFLINPTFSTVNEDKSYLNLYHRNQWIKFDDNYQTYLGSYSGRIGDRMGVGLSVYHQKFATIANFGVMANYAYGVKLAEKSNLTFGFNLSYYDSGIDQSDVNSVQPDDPRLQELDGNSLLSFQPGINLSLGSFDVGVYAENLFDYNLKSGSSLTDFDEKTYTGHLMYTNRFKSTNGLMENGRFSVLTRARSIAGDDVNLSGSLILDLPKLGWVQTGYDDFYGIAAGLGFNLTDRISIGYSIEKGLDDQVSNFGVTHEVNFAYSFTPTLTENRVFEDFEDQDQLVYSKEENEEAIGDKDAEIARLKTLVEENNLIIEEMMFRQDSMEAARKKDINKRFAYMQKFVKDYANRDNQAEFQEQLKQFKKDLDEGVVFTEPTIDTTRYAKAAPAIAAPVSYAMKPVSESNNNSKEKTYSSSKDEVNKQESVVTSVKKTVVPTTDDQSADAISDKNKAVVKNYKNIDPIDRSRPVLTSTSTAEVVGASKGYYLIVAAFRKPSNLKRFISKLEDRGIEASYFTKNGLNYVYLNRYNSLAEAKEAYATNMDGVYHGKSWVLSVRKDSNTAPKGTLLAQNESKKSTNMPVIAQAEGKQDNYKQYIDRDRAILSECTDRYVQNLIRPFMKPEDRKVLYAENRMPETKKPQGMKRYYIVANVYENEGYANRFVDSLKKRGIEANIYINPRNKYKYVYLQKCDSWQQAMSSYRSDVNQTYSDDIWIMPVGSS
ncbi:PorP/SprF family type IX secretion system membrane protein [Robertkochia sediminum]|uniref:PorP/SprF family type IX secretion system membrane protein n=1 Tax=Robertkochia sediminum TaxID=2785326 RepID=UPI001931CC14|nr:PorP/SprF family type IX secretion system membrane protein [Robertkochia sediminum]MBL7471486.1 PorP/SprF family type IX secretion system membrane protein [Robertkochia sediminum]